MSTAVDQQPNEAPEGSGLERGLTNRHIQLMAIGGAIGTGLFMGSGKSISLAGPAITVVYAVIGFMLFFMMRAMGEVLIWFAVMSVGLVATRRARTAALERQTVDA